jgi:hypothetical protein
MMAEKDIDMALRATWLAEHVTNAPRALLQSESPLRTQRIEIIPNRD